MAESANNVVDSWEDIDENEMFEQSKAVSEPKKIGIFKGPMIFQGEDSLRTQYLPPEPSVKILKRPSRDERLNASIDGCVNGNSKPVKSLRQREAEYAEARQRIMGNAHDEFESLETEDSGITSDNNSTVYTLLRPPVEGPRTAPDILRNPKGPDGSPGFTLRR